MNNYFAYGSNLSEQRKIERQLTLEFVSAAYIDSYELCFPRYSKRNNGGVASFKECAGARVYGAIYRATSEDLEKLDIAEGYQLGSHENAYERIEIQVKNMENQSINCITYRANADHTKFFKPSAEYLKLIVDGLSNLVSFGLPGIYVEEVKKKF